MRGAGCWCRCVSFPAQEKTVYGIASSVASWLCDLASYVSTSCLVDLMSVVRDEKPCV